MVQYLRLCTLQCREPGLIPGQGIRSHMPQLERPHLLQGRWKIPSAATKTRHGHINTWTLKIEVSLKSKVQSRKMKKGAAFVLFKDRQLGRKLGGEEDFHIVEDQFSIWRTKLLSAPTHPGWKGFSNRAIKGSIIPSITRLSQWVCLWATVRYLQSFNSTLYLGLQPAI